MSLIDFRVSVTLAEEDVQTKSTSSCLLLCCTLCSKEGHFSVGTFTMLMGVVPASAGVAQEMSSECSMCCVATKKAPGPMNTTDKNSMLAST
jgi:hypothetical protein